MMTIPGLALFYGGMVRKKNVLATMMQCFAICRLVTVLWMVAGYSLAFADGNAYVGDLSRVLLSGMAETWDKPFTLGSRRRGGGDDHPRDRLHDVPDDLRHHHPGADHRRLRRPDEVLRAGGLHILWSLLVYAPVAHWVWHPNGWIFALGALDFAGGTVVHINAGVAGLVCAMVLGKRVGYGNDNMAPYNLALA